uniref:Uncharacterized protein n=1 Tax=Panagrolaimus sp. JU765 TaxID=591449 RepID=A0AC34R8R6_9BILA
MTISKLEKNDANLQSLSTNIRSSGRSLRSTRTHNSNSRRLSPIRNSSTRRSSPGRNSQLISKEMDGSGTGLSICDVFYVLTFTVLFIFQIIFMCATNKKDFRNTRTRTGLSPGESRIRLVGDLTTLPSSRSDLKFHSNNRKPGSPLLFLPRMGDGEDTLQNVTSIAPDNETSLFMLTSYTQTGFIDSPVPGVPVDLASPPESVAD